jgi:hypothetical protein
MCIRSFLSLQICGHGLFEWRLWLGNSVLKIIHMPDAEISTFYHTVISCSDGFQGVYCCLWPRNILWNIVCTLCLLAIQHLCVCICWKHETHMPYLPYTVGHAVVQWLRHCATNWKVVGLIPDGVIRIFHWHDPCGRTKALRLTQPVTEMSTRNISWGKGSWCIGLTTLPPSCANCLKIWEPQPPGNLSGIVFYYIQ